MPLHLIATYLFALLIAITALFQLALALGAPWGEWAMGGQYPGKFPPRLRIAAVVQLVILVLLAVVVAIRAGLLLDAYFRFANRAIWGVVIFCTISAVLNLITPSKKERLLWAPVTLLLLISSLVVAFAPA